MRRLDAQTRQPLEARHLQRQGPRNTCSSMQSNKGQPHVQTAHAQCAQTREGGQHWGEGVQQPTPRGYNHIPVACAPRPVMAPSTSANKSSMSDMRVHAAQRCKHATSDARLCARARNVNIAALPLMKCGGTSVLYSRTISGSTPNLFARDARCALPCARRRTLPAVATVWVVRCAACIPPAWLRLTGLWSPRFGSARWKAEGG